MKELMKNLTSLEQFETLYKEDKVTMFVFSADWCPDCRFIEPFLPKVIEDYDDFNFIYVDRDLWLNLCQQMMVMGIPSFVAIRNGKELGRFVSKLRKTETEIRQFMEECRA